MAATRRGRRLWPRRWALACTIGGAMVWFATTVTSFYGWYPRLACCLTVGNGHFLLVWGKTEGSSMDRGVYLARKAMLPKAFDACQFGGLERNSEWYFTWPGLGTLFSGEFWSWDHVGVGLPRLHNEYDIWGASKERGLLIPACWFAVVPGVFTLWFYWRTRRAPPGFCQCCGYNLTGNTSGICPECATPCPDAVASSPPPQQTA
jgi:hypothetical protein